MNKRVVIVIVAALHVLTFAVAAKSDSYVELVRKANERTQARDWPAAGLLWEQVVKINPHVADSWLSLGRAWVSAGEYRKAIPALEKARELGAGNLPSSVTYEIARAYGQLKEADATLDWLQRSLDDGARSRDVIRTDQTFEFLRENPRFKEITGVVDTERMSRAEGWRYDLAFLQTELERVHVSPFRKESQADLEGEIKALSSDVDKLSDNEMIVRVMRVMAKIGDGHTVCFPEAVPGWTQTVPLQFEVFPEGVFIISADSSRADLVGARVLKVGDHKVEKVIEKLDPIISKDNAYGLMRSGGRYMRYPQILNGLGLLPQAESLPLTVRDAKGKERSVTVAAVPTDANFNRITGHPRWTTVYENAAGPVPLYLKDRRTFYWFEPLPDPKTVYCQFNSVSDGPSETLSGFSNRLFEYIDQNNVETLILDMRWNNGGNSKLLPPLVTGLIRSNVNRTGHLFVIVGRYTYSAAMNASTFIEQNTNAIFVGEQTPSSPNFVGESNVISLPYSKTGVSISDLFWQSSWPTDRRTWIAPFLYAPPTFEAYKSKRDPAMEAISTYSQGD